MEIYATPTPIPLPLAGGSLVRRLHAARNDAAATLAAVRVHMLERIGRLLRFSPVGRPVRVWVEGMPGADETRVVPGTITELRDGGAVVYLREPEQEPRWILAVPRDPGWGLSALWFSFIAVDAFELENGERVGEWHIRLGSRR